MTKTFSILVITVIIAVIIGAFSLHWLLGLLVLIYLFGAILRS